MIINIFPNEDFLFSNLMTNTWPLQMLVKSSEAYCMMHTCEHVSKDQNQFILTISRLWIPNCESYNLACVYYHGKLQNSYYKMDSINFQPVPDFRSGFPAYWRLCFLYAEILFLSNYSLFVWTAIQNLQSEKLSENHVGLDRGPRGLKHKNFHLVTSIKNFNEIKKCFD